MKNRSVDIRYAVDGAKLPDVRKKIDELISQFGPDARLEFGAYEEYGSSVFEVSLCFTTPETEEEGNQRVAREKQYKEARHRDFLRLKKEFNDE